MKRFRGKSQLRRGAALFVVTIVIVLVSLSAYGFVVLMQAEHRAARLSADRTQVQLVAESASEYLQSLLAMSRVERDMLGGWHENPGRFRDIVVDPDPLGQRHGRFSVVSPRDLESASSHGFQFGVESTSAKLSLAALVAWDEVAPGSARLALMRIPGMNETTADSLLDWIDSDETPREFGAESEFYLGLNPPRSPFNQVPTHLDQLLAVRGVRTADLLGSNAAANDDAMTQSLPTVEQNPLAAPAPAQAGVSALDSATIEQHPWSHYLTVYSAERNETYDGFPRINLNQKDLVGLHEQLSSRLNRQLADFVVVLRQFGPREQAGIALSASELPAIDLTASAKYELTSPLDVVDARVGIPDGSDEDEIKVFKSPISTESSSDLNVVEFCDQTTTAEPTIFGRVDVNRAPREVLEAIPHFPREAVEQVISLRVTGALPLPERKHATWLLAEGIVDYETMQQLLPFVTTTGDVIQGEIVAYYDRSSPWHRNEFVLDGTRAENPVLFYRDLRRAGRGYRYDEVSLDADTSDTPPTSSAREAASQHAAGSPIDVQPERSRVR